MPRVLVVDDQPIKLEYAQHRFQYADLVVDVASNGIEALRLAHACPPDLFVLDIRMSEMTGYELCAAIREDAALKTIPVILYSAGDMSLDQAERVRNLGARFVPFKHDFSEMLVAARELLA